MGEIADMMLDGTLDIETCEFLGEAVGYPRTARRDAYDDIDSWTTAPTKKKSGGTKKKCACPV